MLDGTTGDISMNEQQNSSEDNNNNNVESNENNATANSASSSSRPIQMIPINLGGRKDSKDNGKVFIIRI